MAVLKFGDSGPSVETLQKQLNCSPPYVGKSGKTYTTRLERLGVDGDFGVLTTARVMEFQLQKQIFVDGVVGSGTNGKLKGIPSECNPSKPRYRAILVNLVNNRLDIYHNGKKEFRVSPISGGKARFLSDRGVFFIYKRKEKHSSSKFPPPPGAPRNMDYSLFYNGGEALHQGNPRVKSHGCIHVGKPHAEKLFDWAGSHNVMVIVVRP